MKYLKTIHESFMDIFKKRPEKMTRETLEWIESAVQIINHDIYDIEILRRTSKQGELQFYFRGELIVGERRSKNFYRDIEKYDFVVKDGLFWKFDFKKMMEYPGIKGLWEKSDLLRYYYLKYTEYKHMADFDLTGEIGEGGFYFLHLIDIHKLIGIDKTLEIYKELNS